MNNLLVLRVSLQKDNHKKYSENEVSFWYLIEKNEHEKNNFKHKKTIKKSSTKHDDSKRHQKTSKLKK